VPPVTAVLPLLAVPLAVKAIRHAKANYRDPMALIPANAGTIGLTVVFGILLIAGVAVGIWLPW
jgi:1,4-dihydroxy-2-naphthoate octaprenyltransferase